MKIEVSVRTDRQGSKVIETIELPDDLSEEEIESAAKDVMFNMIDWNWTKIDSEESEQIPN